MIAMAAVVLVGICSFLLFSAVLTHRYHRQRASIDDAVAREVDSRMRAARGLDSELARKLADGRPTREAITEWQAGRAALLPTGRTSRPWAWDADDLQAWRDERAAAYAQDAARRHLATLAVVAVLLVLATGGVTLVLYGHHAAQAVPVDTPPAAAPPSPVPAPPETGPAPDAADQAPPARPES